MDDYRVSTYGHRIAEVYDQWYTARMDPTDAVERLAELAGTRKSPGVGNRYRTDRPAPRGQRSGGIDALQAMVDELRSKPGGDTIEVTIGDFADVAVEGRFSLVYVPFTTFFSLGSRGEQIRCLGNVVTHLESGGWFVLDASVPHPARLRNRQHVSAPEVGVNHVLLDASRHD